MPIEPIENNKKQVRQSYSQVLIPTGRPGKKSTLYSGRMRGPTSLLHAYLSPERKGLPWIERLYGLRFAINFQVKHGREN